MDHFCIGATWSYFLASLLQFFDSFIVSQSDLSKGSCPFGGLTQSLSNQTSASESVILILSGQSVSTQIVFDHGLSWFYHGTAFMKSQR